MSEFASGFPSQPGAAPEAANPDYERCADCDEVFPYPVSLHHTEDECLATQALNAEVDDDDGKTGDDGKPLGEGADPEGTEPVEGEGSEEEGSDKDPAKIDDDPATTDGGEVSLTGDAHPRTEEELAAQSGSGSETSDDTVDDEGTDDSTEDDESDTETTATDDITEEEAAAKRSERAKKAAATRAANKAAKEEAEK